MNILIIIVLKSWLETTLLILNHDKIINNNRIEIIYTQATPGPLNGVVFYYKSSGWTFPFPKILFCWGDLCYPPTSTLITAQSASGMGGFKWMLQRYIMEMSHLKSRRVKLTTGNTSSMQMCILLLFEQVSNTPNHQDIGRNVQQKIKGRPSFLFKFKIGFYNEIETWSKNVKISEQF